LRPRSSKTRIDGAVYERIKAPATFRGTSINAVVGVLLRRGVEAIDGKDARDQKSAK
jgi:hypothetical protein